MKRATINSDTFHIIFNEEKTDLLEKLAAALTKIKIENFKDNITSDIQNKNKKKYIISMPDDKTFIILNTITKEKIIKHF